MRWSTYLGQGPRLPVEVEGEVEVVQVLEHPQRDAPDGMLRDAREDRVAQLVEPGGPCPRDAVPEVDSRVGSRGAKRNKLGNAWVFVRLIFCPGWSGNQPC